MCTNLHYIYNSYIRKRILVSCGKCDACKQQKADARAFRIKTSCPADYVQLFVTLTYNNSSLPVVRKSDLKEFSFVPIYRYNGGNLKEIGSQYLGELPFEFDYSLTPTPRRLGDNNFLGVCFYKDIQNFFKRLRITLQRKYNYEKRFKYYACTEYGETYFRPHAHVVLTVPKTDVELFRSVVASCWPYADYNRTYKNIEIARHVGEYVASYVNSDTSLPKILQTPAFRQKHAYSQGYGVDFSAFSCVEIVKAANRNSFSFSRANTSGNSGCNTFLIPKYVVNRHFPQFKGLSQLTTAEIYSVLLRPSRLAEIFNGRFAESSYHIKNFVSDPEIRNLCVRLTNSFERYYNSFISRGIVRNYYDYILDYIRIWKCYETTKLRLFYQSQSDDIYHEPADYYDNLVDVDFGLVRCSYVDSLCSDISKYVNYNALPSRVNLTESYRLRYRRKVKQKKVVNSVLQRLYDDI